MTEAARDRKLEERLARIRHKVLVLSGKGGVGKSTVAVNLAVALQLAGYNVGLLDVDLHGPSVPTMLGLEGASLHYSNENVLPAVRDGLKVMSLGLLLPNQDEAVIWRGPLKMGAIGNMIGDVAWGDLDVLMVDLPPGTGDEPLSVCQLLGKVDGAVIVTTPQKVAAVDVRKSISFCRRLSVPILGVVENMSGFACPGCGLVTTILRSGGGRKMADEMCVPFLGSIPMDPQIADSGDEGQPFLHYRPDSLTADIIWQILKPVEQLINERLSDPTAAPQPTEEMQKMKIAIPLADGVLARHFGHCEKFALLNVETASGTILQRDDVTPPPHEPGLLPPWLAERGVNLVIAGGMGQRAVGLFTEKGIQVVVGAPTETPERLAENWLAGQLESGVNVCDH